MTRLTGDERIAQLPTQDKPRRKVSQHCELYGFFDEFGNLDGQSLATAMIDLGLAGQRLIIRITTVE